MHALDAESGELLWSYQTFGAVLASPVVTNGRIYISTEDGYVYVLFGGVPELEPQPEGRLLWRFLSGDYVGSSR